MSIEMRAKILTEQQIIDLRGVASPGSLLGTRVDYLFMHDDPPSTKRGVCGLYGYVVAERQEQPADPYRLSIAFETPIDKFFVVQHGFVCLMSPIHQEKDARCVVDFADYAEIMDSVFPGWHTH